MIRELNFDDMHFSSVFANAVPRMNNSVKYVSPRTQGVNLEVAYSAGESGSDGSAGESAGAALVLSRGALNARLGYHYRNNDTATLQGREPGRNALLAMNYDLKVVKLYFAYGVNQGLNSAQLPVANAYGHAVAPIPSVDSHDMLLGAQVPFASGKLMATMVRRDDRSAPNQDATLFAVGYSYFLSKRTDLYTSYGRMHNRDGAGYTVNSAIEFGSGDRAVNLGIRHLF